MMDYWKNWFFWTAIMVIGVLAVAGYNAMTADRTATYEDYSDGTCGYYAKAGEECP